MSNTQIIRYQLGFPYLDKKLYTTSVKTYNIAIVYIRLDELQKKGAKITKIGKPTNGGTLLTFEPVKSCQEYEEALKSIIQDGEYMGLIFEKEKKKNDQQKESD